jgi:hypothetical protein
MMTEEQMLELWHKSGGDIYVYADLVAEHEREGCAKIAEEPWQGSPKAIAEQIRARGQE